MFVVLCCSVCMYVHLLGVEFLMSTQAFYCSLCDVFLGSCTCAETHCKSDEHNDKYAVSIVPYLCHFEYSEVTETDLIFSTSRYPEAIE